MSQIYGGVKQTAKNLFAIPKVLSAPKERRASVFGMVESGKTTVLGLLEITCVNYANDANKKGSKTHFHYLVQERSSGIRQAAGELREGMFPEKTPADHIFEADFLMRFGKTFGEQQIRLPFCETAGETFTKLLDRFQRGMYEITPQMQDAALIHDYILDTDAIVLIAPVPRVLGMEKEIGAKIDLPDVNLSRLLAGIYGYKMEDAQTNPSGHRPIRGIAVFLTKYDAAEIYLESKQMSLKTQEGVHRFMSKYFPETYAVLGWYGLENVRFWPTGVAIETDEIETGEIDDLGRPVKKRVGRLHPKNPKRGYAIKRDYNRNIPIYTQEPFYEFIEWCRTVVMKSQ